MVSSKTGWPSVSILGIGEIAKLSRPFAPRESRHVSLDCHRERLPLALLVPEFVIPVQRLNCCGVKQYSEPAKQLVYAHAHTHTHTHARARAHTHTHTHKHTHAHTHARARARTHKIHYSLRGPFKLVDNHSTFVSVFPITSLLVFPKLCQQRNRDREGGR